jgi:hypothetical protein
MKLTQEIENEEVKSLLGKFPSQKSDCLVVCHGNDFDRFAGSILALPTRPGLAPVYSYRIITKLNNNYS